ncbi:glycerate kinase [Vibrio aestuarianus]|uniref:glycerate kinase family protein n=1 Tax=Vibrio aestuarianus TaxID=28171 RepID=UPI00237CF01A|nr:glycerate kinase [Vibrio aestuarianus]MDE1333667.1 glycerate kinase [Vibrio aestuarianus]
MKIVIAPDSFKECLSARLAAETIAEGIKSVLPKIECVCVPVADGGEGTMTALVEATDGFMLSKRVCGPLGKIVNASYGILGDGKTAVIEMATASGIELLRKEERNPMWTTSFGTGELVLAALDRGVNKIIVAIGGSATNDGGIGMLQALGAKLMDSSGNQVGFGGGSLIDIMSIDISTMDPRLAKTEIVVACDVDNPLTGENGASIIFGPQKGATPEMSVLLDRNMKHFASCIRKFLNVDVEFTKGAGAAGGMGAALMAFLKAELKPGIEIVLDTVELEKYLLDADLVITGEGKIDGQTLHGKTPVGVSKLAQKNNIQTIAIAGVVGDGTDALKQAGIVACFSVTQGPCELDNAIQNGKDNLFKTSKQVAGLLSLFV